MVRQLNPGDAVDDLGLQRHQMQGIDLFRYPEQHAAAVAGGLGALCGSLPDVLEPAIHPNHRQFFHSVAFGVLLGRGLLSLYRWQPDDDAGRMLRAIGLVASGAYLTHLVMDATTAKSIPLVGKL